MNTLFSALTGKRSVPPIAGWAGPRGTIKNDNSFQESPALMGGELHKARALGRVEDDKEFDYVVAEVSEFMGNP